MSAPQTDLVHDWNGHSSVDPSKVKVLDDTLRDGLQSPTARQPSLEHKKAIIRLIDRLGLDGVTLGLPGAGAGAERDIVALARYCAASGFDLDLVSAVRTHPADVIAHLRTCEAAGTAITASLFIGSSPIRRVVETWTLGELIDKARSSVRACRQAGVPVMFVTEDTTRSSPADLNAIYSAAIDEGAARICVADTVGAVDPSGARAIVEFVLEIIAKSGAQVGLDWHGHNDRGLALANSLAAVESGADRVHATFLGLGERAGNTALDQVLLNLKLMGQDMPEDLEVLQEVCGIVAQRCNAPIPANYPALGEDAFRTSTGVHAAAIAKAHRTGDMWLADQVYSTVSASWYGRAQRIEIGPMSGKSNVAFWLSQHYPDLPEDLEQSCIDAVLSVAKTARAVLTDAEIAVLVDRQIDLSAPVASSQALGAAQ